MGLLDQLAGMLAGNAGAAGGGASLGGISPAMIQQVLGMLGGSGGAAGGGGLGSLVAAFEQGGLGHVVQSWISTGANLPVTGAQLQQVLGNGQIGQIAHALGLDHGAAAGSLAEILPQLVNHLTPNGQVPAAGDLQASLSSLAKQLMPS